MGTEPIPPCQEINHHHHYQAHPIPHITTQPCCPVTSNANASECQYCTLPKRTQIRGWYPTEEGERAGRWRPPHHITLPRLAEVLQPQVGECGSAGSETRRARVGAERARLGSAGLGWVQVGMPWRRWVGVGPVARVGSRGVGCYYKCSFTFTCTQSHVELPVMRWE